MHELEDGFAAAVVCAVIVLIGIIVGSLFKFRAGGSSYLAIDHAACLLARRGERHRAAAGKVDCIHRGVSCIDNAISFCIQCQINSRIPDGQLALFNICRIALRAYLDGAVLNNQIAAISCPNSLTACCGRGECHIRFVLDDDIPVVIVDADLKITRNIHLCVIQRDCAAATRANTDIRFVIVQAHGQLPADVDVVVVGCGRRCLCFVVNTVGGLISACCGNGLICAGQRDRTALCINAVHRAILRCVIFPDRHIQRRGDCDALSCENAIDITTTIRSHSQLAGAGDVQLAFAGLNADQIIGICLGCGKAAVALNHNVQVASRHNSAVFPNAFVVLEEQRTAGRLVAGDMALRAVIADACFGSTICGKVLLVAEADKFAGIVVQRDISIRSCRQRRHAHGGQQREQHHNTEQDA